jgi:hypothetical protein
MRKTRSKQKRIPRGVGKNQEKSVTKKDRKHKQKHKTKKELAKEIFRANPDARVRDVAEILYRRPYRTR